MSCCWNCDRVSFRHEDAAVWCARKDMLVRPEEGSLCSDHRAPLPSDEPSTVKKGKKDVVERFTLGR